MTGSGRTPQPSLGPEFRVSVIIPVYNAARRVRRALESALALPQVAEVILIEDGSPDDALSVCEGLVAEFGNVVLLRHPDGANRGAGASRNLGVRHARFPYIAFLDADDRYLPNRFAADSAILSSAEDVDGVYNAIGREFETEAVRAQWIQQGRPEILTVSGPVAPEELIYVLLWAHPAATGDFHTIALTVRREFFWRVGGFSESLRLQQDTHLWKRMAAAGRLAAGSIVEPVAIQCVHPDNRMTRLDEQDKYRELWWRSLRESFRDLGVARPVLQAYRRSYSRFRSTRRPRWKAIIALSQWLLRDPAQVLMPYGHFDLTFRQIFGRRPFVLRLLSLKNRLAGYLMAWRVNE